jgi:hypothetical protein
MVRRGAGVQVAKQTSMTDPCRFVVWQHHPDMLRRPTTGSTEARAAQALTWNIFRTAELLPPAFWLRRLNASLGIALPRPAPVTARVQIWTRLPVPPGQGLSLREAVDVDVVIETDHDVWALLVCNDDIGPPHTESGIDRLAMMAYAASWYAGRRQCYVGMIVTAPERAPLGVSLIRKYQLSSQALQLRWPHRHHDGGNISGIGFTTWERLGTILGDASHSASLGAVERTIARETLAWCDGLAYASVMARAPVS